MAPSLLPGHFMISVDANPLPCAVNNANKPMLRSVLASLLSIGVAATPAGADPVEDFYKGKSITIVTSTGVGGPFDLTARALARHMQQYVVWSGTT